MLAHPPRKFAWYLQTINNMLPWKIRNNHSRCLKNIIGHTSYYFKILLTIVSYCRTTLGQICASNQMFLINLHGNVLFSLWHCTFYFLLLVAELLYISKLLVYPSVSFLQGLMWFSQLNNSVAILFIFNSGKSIWQYCITDSFDI